MKPTPEAAWERVEALAGSLGMIPVERLGAELEKLRNDGESPTVLTLLSGLLSLPPLPTGLAEGMVIGGRYTLRSIIGEGGMGTVWRARQENVGRDVALKMIHPALATPDLRSRFKQEIEMLSRLDHPGIVKIFDAGIHSTPEHPEIPYFAMELVEGEPLDKWAAKTRAEQGDLLQTAAFLCLAIHSAHERQIVHRDLKPSNILVKPGGQPVILDFGIARLAGIAAGDEGHQFSGTPIYAAPEQHLGNDRDFRSGESVDVYAMGAIVFEMLSGRKLFDISSKAPFAEIRKAVLEAKPSRLSEVLENCPQELDDVVARAVRRNPADRFFSIAALGRALLRAAATVENGQGETPSWRPGAGQTIPGTGWCLTEHLGSGSTGEVWLGRHADTGVVNVFKFCDSEEKVRSLKREATLFRLMKERVGQHPNLIQLHEVSLDEPPYYLMMERCDAKELGIWCNEQPNGLAGLPEEARLEIVAQAADALQAAHDAGILHRDIKPANLLVQGSPADHGLHVYVADFGIGQIVAEDLLLNGTLAGFTGTVSGAISGSLRYLAPEVLEGHTATARSDIYCLGIVLWQLLIGNLNAALDPIDWASRIQDPLLREDLARCLAGKPEYRWNSAAELAASLRSLPVRREGERNRRLQEEARERAAFRRGAMRSAVVVAFVLSVVAASLWIAWIRSRDAKDAANQVAITRTRTSISELWKLQEAHSGDARRKLDEKMAGDALLRNGFEGELRELSTAILALPSFQPITPPPFTLGSSDYISSAGDWLGRISTNGSEVVELATGMHFPFPWMPTNGPAKKIFINQSGRVAGVLDADGNLTFRRRRLLTDRKFIPGPVNMDCFTIAPLRFGWDSSTVIAVARPSGAIDLYPLEETNAPTTIIRGTNMTRGVFPTSTPANLLAMSKAKHGLLAAAGPDSGFVLLWSVSAEKKAGPVSQFAGSLWHPDDILCMAWNPSVNELATGCKDGSLRFWKPSSTPESPQIEPANKVDLGEAITSLAWSADGSIIAALLQSGRIKILWPTGSQFRTVAELDHKGATSISFATENRLVSWGSGQTRIWATEPSGSFFNQRYVGPASVRLGLHRQGSLMVSSSGIWRFLDPASLAETASMVTTDAKGAIVKNTQLGYFTEGAWKTMEIWTDTNISGGLTFRRAIDVSPEVEAELVSPFSRQTALIKLSTLTVVSEQTNRFIPAALPPKRREEALSDWEPSSAWIVGDEVHFFNHQTGKAGSANLGRSVLGLSFSPKAPLIACRTETAVVLIDSQTGNLVTHDVLAPGPYASPLAFSPDGRSLAFVGDSGDLVIGTLPDNGAPVFTAKSAMLQFSDMNRLRSPVHHPISQIVWTHTGSHLCAGTADGFVQSWNLSLIRKQLRLYRLNWGGDDLPSQPAFTPFRAEWP